MTRSHRIPRLGTRTRQGLLSAIAFAAIAAGASAALAPTVSWVTTSTAPEASDVAGYSVSALADGGSLVTGQFKGAAVDFGDGTARDSAGGGASRALFTERLDRDGSVRWVRTSTAPGASETQGYGVSALPDGDSLVTGFFKGIGVNLGDGTARDSANGGTAESSFITRLGADGSVRWVRTSAGGSETVGYGVSALADGSSVVTGQFRGAAVDLGDGVPRDSGWGGNNTSAFTEGVGPDGSVRWVRTSTSASSNFSQALGNSVSALPDGTSVVAGIFEGTGVDLGDGISRTSAADGANASAFTQGLGSDGSVRWVRVSEGGIRTGANGVGMLADGSSIAAGFFKGPAVDLGDGALRSSANAGASYSAFTEKFGADGSVRWVRTSTAPGTSDTGADGVSVLSDGTSVVTGDFQGAAVDFGDGIPRDSANGGADFSLFTVGYGADGSVRWVRSSTATGTSDTRSWGVSALPDGSSVVTGYFQGAAVDFGATTARTSAGAGAGLSVFAQRIVDISLPPAAPVATAGDAQAAVRITPLAGGSVTSYTVNANIGGGTCTIVPPATSCTVGGLFNGIGYTFTATATNAAGTSAASPASNAVRPKAAPPGALRSRTRCTPKGCTTTGTLPARATSVVQSASGGGAQAARMARDMTRKTTPCRLTTTRTARSFTCKVRLGTGRWTLTTRARARSTVVAQSAKRVRVGTTARAAVTG